MTTSIRELRERLDREHAEADGSGEDLGPVFCLLWIVSVAKVVLT